MPEAVIESLRFPISRIFFSITRDLWEICGSEVKLMPILMTHINCLSLFLFAGADKYFLFQFKTVNVSSKSCGEVPHLHLHLNQGSICIEK